MHMHSIIHTCCNVSIIENMLHIIMHPLSKCQLIPQYALTNHQTGGKSMSSPATPNVSLAFYSTLCHLLGWQPGRLTGLLVIVRVCWMLLNLKMDLWTSNQHGHILAHIPIFQKFSQKFSNVVTWNTSLTTMVANRGSYKGIHRPIGMICPKYFPSLYNLP